VVATGSPHAIVRGAHGDTGDGDGRDDQADRLAAGTLPVRRTLMDDEPDCLDCDCDGPCEMADLPIWLRPYYCRLVTNVERRARDLAWQEAESTPDGG
jgi:hypothetical protein